LVLLWRWEFYKSKKSKLHQKDANMVAISLMIVMIWGVHLLCFAGCIFSYEGNRREAFCISNRLVNLILRIVTAKIWVQVGFHANLLLHCCQSHCSCWVRSICCLPDVLLLPVKVSDLLLGLFVLLQFYRQWDLVHWQQGREKARLERR
jgi:hypothetical protein